MMKRSVEWRRSRWAPRTSRVLTVAALASLPWAGASAQQDPGTGDVTFAGEVALILQENCQVCHRPGAIAPMSLLSYEQVRPWGPLIREKVVTREMPPYHYDADVGVQRLKGDMRLSQAEIETIAAWVDGGMPLGDPGSLPPPVTWPDPDAWRLAKDFGEPDLVVASTASKFTMG